MYLVTAENFKIFGINEKGQLNPPLSLEQQLPLSFPPPHLSLSPIDIPPSHLKVHQTTSSTKPQQQQQNG